jgi:two-component system phosphate regulon response regulator PhoB
MEKQKVILIVEDEKNLREAIADILHRKNFLTLEAKNGQEGVDLALSKHPDLILLDLLMPVMDGMTALKQIRQADAWGEQVPTLILTNLSSTEETEHDIAAEKPLGYLIKSSWKIEDVVEKIEKILATPNGK